jgi:prepilin-type N-terminal cleavage/methylation domain-containing protein
MLKVLGSKKGFTLVELLIVMFIIAILVTLSVGAYTAYRKVALIDLNADLLVSQINEMRDKVVHGTEFGESLKCFGLKFEKDAEADVGTYKMSAISYDFTDKKVWDAVLKKWLYEGCNGESDDKLIFEIDPMVKVDSIKSGIDSGIQEFTGDALAFRFVPPNGDIEIAESEIGDNLFVKLRYGEGTDERYSRIVLINLTTGKITKD